MVICKKLTWFILTTLFSLIMIIGGAIVGPIWIIHKSIEMFSNSELKKLERKRIKKELKDEYRNKTTQVE